MGEGEREGGVRVGGGGGDREEGRVEREGQR